MRLCTFRIPYSHLCRQGVAEALLSCIRRFKRHDSVLVEVYKFIGPRYEPKPEEGEALLMASEPIAHTSCMGRRGQCGARGRGGVR